MQCATPRVRSSPHLFIYEGNPKPSAAGTDGDHHLARSASGSGAREIRVRVGASSRGKGRGKELASSAPKTRYDRHAPTTTEARRAVGGLPSALTRAEPPEVFRAPSHAPSRPRASVRLRESACARSSGVAVGVVRARAVLSFSDRVSERVGLSGAEPRHYCRAESAIVHWSAEDSPTPSPIQPIR